MKNNIIVFIKYLLIGIAVAIGGMFFSALCGDFFNGLGDYGIAAVFGICLYLCIVIVICTGLILNRLDRNKSDKKDEKQSDE